MRRIASHADRGYTCIKLNDSQVPENAKIAKRSAKIMDLPGSNGVWSVENVVSLNQVQEDWLGSRSTTKLDIFSFLFLTFAFMRYFEQIYIFLLFRSSFQLFFVDS